MPKKGMEGHIIRKYNSFKFPSQEEITTQQDVAVCASKEQHKGNKNFVSSVSRSYES
jgi:hypothetical protein